MSLGPGRRAAGPRPGLLPAVGLPAGPAGARGRRRRRPLTGRSTVKDAYDAFLAWYATYRHPVLFLGVLLENAGVPVPGETAVPVAAFLASPERAGGSSTSAG
jgi:hypothetical protein